MSFGFTKFLMHSSLSYNSTTNTEYLQNDCLRLRVRKVVVYSPPLLVKTPSWQQDPHNVSQSMCEFTLSEFSKRKQLNNFFFCPPFYSHQNGYNLCVSVYSNGRGDGTNIHVSVYVRLTTGKFDDKLQWPFVGDVIIELLNWRENKKHYNKRTVSINSTSNFARALEAMYGSSLRYHQFILHPLLSYNSTTNTEYDIPAGGLLAIQSIHYQVTASHHTNMCKHILYTSNLPKAMIQAFCVFKAN